jgi:D-serine deaminase-like pyridoxal phosphate-dependent protein
VITTPSDAAVRLGQSKDEIETPAVVVDEDIMQRNLKDFASFADEQDVSLRSHVKTHKIPALAHRQVDRTGGGVVCQTLSEVEVMAHGGIDDVYLSYIVATQPKLDRLVHLSETLDSFVTTVDSKGNIDPLQAAAAEYDVTVDVVLELDIGLNRLGAQPADAVELARYVSDAPNLGFCGIMAFEAHIKRTAETRAEYDEQCHQAMEEVAAIVEDIEGAGIPVEEVKVGSTGTSKHSGKHPVVTEINPGMYPFNDVGELGRVSKEECALTVLTTVISVPTEDRVIVDAGSKTMAMDTGRNPVPKHRDDIEYFNASEEHGWIDTSGSTEEFSVGNRIEFIIPHVCTTINLHDTLIGLRDGVVENVWDVQGRGKVK